ncbi:MAG: hypothetical protein IPO87_07945 [Flavobacteriales bacterium]|nr:hypothetical protein [Flavobacteriales bacterium]
MRTIHFPSLLLVAVLVVIGCNRQGPSTAADMPPGTANYGCGPTLTTDKDWYTSGKHEPLLPGLSGLHYPITTRSDSAQRYFDQGLVLAYGFNHAEAARSFWEAARIDTTCAMAWWGFAYVLGPNYNAGMEPDSYARAYYAITKAQALSSGCTAKEKGLIDAMAKRYTPAPQADRSALDKAYGEAMRALTNTYPTDADIATLFAESLMDQHPWDLWDHAGNAKSWTPEIVSALQRSMKNFPTHFGAHHLYIHAVEASRTPELGLPSAAFLEHAVPGSGHLVHMPSHIYIRTGRYHDGVLANQRSVSVDSGYTAWCHANGIYPLAYFPHNIHFLSTCATMEGNRTLAWNTALDLREHVAHDLLTDPNWSTLQHFQAFPYMVAVKLALWDKLKAEAMPDSSWKYATAMWHYSQGMRNVHDGNTKGAEEHLLALRTCAKDSSVLAMRVWGINPATQILAVADGVLEGGILMAEGKADDGIQRLTEAVVAEDALQYQEPRDWSFPVRHELGTALLLAHRPAEAEAVYRRDLLDWPENGYALQGLRKALEDAGKNQEASALEPRIIQATAYADRPELFGMR